MGLLNVGARALMANQVALQTAGNNIANVNTPGYSRQTVALQTVQGQFSGAGSIGHGVDVRTMDRHDLRARSGYVEQDAPVLAGTLRDNLLIGAPDADDNACIAVLRDVNLGGVLDRHPGLRVKIVHGGGFLPFLIGRLDHAWKHRPEVHRLTAQAPSAYLSRLWYDTVVFDPRLLRMLFELVGPGRIMLGSDYPFDMGEATPRATLAAAGIPAEEIAAIESGTARAFFRI